MFDFLGQEQHLPCLHYPFQALNGSSFESRPCYPKELLQKLAYRMVIFHRSRHIGEKQSPSEDQFFARTQAFLFPLNDWAWIDIKLQ
jgi:hypothetical protein